MVIPSAVIAFVARNCKETILIVGSIGRVVDMAVGITVGLAAYHIDSG